jgi:hypothetical protein
MRNIAMFCLIPLICGKNAEKWTLCEFWHEPSGVEITVPESFKDVRRTPGARFELATNGLTVPSSV